MRSRQTNIHRVSDQRGFTIIELMIATAVFSFILVLVTFGVISFSNAYYKGVNNSTTQTAAQSAMDTISQAVQFSGSKVVGDTVYNQPGANNGITYFCADGKVFVYRPGVQYLGAAATETSPGLYQSDAAGGCQPPTPAGDGTYAGTNGKQLLGKHMRLAVLALRTNDNAGGATPDSIAQSYTISIRIAFSSGGDPAHDGDDLLCKPSGTAYKTQCTTPYGTGAVAADFSGSDIRCRSQTGSQFCAVYGLTSSVLQRLATN